MERFINILIIDDDIENTLALKKMLSTGGNNLIFTTSEQQAWEVVHKQKVGIILINSNNKSVDTYDLLLKLKQNPNSRDIYKVIISDENTSGTDLVLAFKKGAVDYISKPFNSSLVKAKIDVFKTLYFKDLRILQLLENIFPVNVLNSLNNTGKYSPRKVNEGVVLFTDFTAFTKHAKDLTPLELINRLKDYFNKFDEIIERYNLEKIKTIGDAYMALAGVNEDNHQPAVRATLAALEIRNYVLSQKTIDIATNKTPWDIRIGIHLGPLVAGIIGTKKMSFDIWGDTVNIAARAEQHSIKNNITITDSVVEHIKEYFNITYRGEIQVKHGGQVKMYFVNELKKDHSLFNEGKLPDRDLRIKCDLPPMDYDYLRRYMVNRLKALLPEELDYHNYKHTINVESAAQRIANLEGVKGEELILLLTAVLFHDAGFIYQYDDNETFGIQLAQYELPKFGYTRVQVETICGIIESTKRGNTPTTLLQKIMRDADHDYLGRPDYFVVAKTLRNELESHGKFMTEIEWIDFQLNYLENVHRYFTETSLNMRIKGKKRRIAELKKQRKYLA